MIKNNKNGNKNSQRYSLICNKKKNRKLYQNAWEELLTVHSIYTTIAQSYAYKHELMFYENV